MNRVEERKVMLLLLSAQVPLPHKKYRQIGIIVGDSVELWKYHQISRILGDSG